MNRLTTLVCCLLFSLACYGQETVVNIDISRLDITGFSESDIFIRYDNRMRAIPVEQKVITLNVNNLPTIIELRTRNKRKFIPLKLLWVEQPDLVIEGSIQDKTVSPVPFTDLQAITDQINKNREPNPEKEPELAFSKPFMVYLNSKRDFLKNKYLEQLVDLAPESIRDFWAYQSLANFMAGQKSLGYDPDTKIFSHLTALNKAQKEQEVRLTGDKPILIDFSSSSCRPCLEDIPKMVAIHDNYEDQLDMLTMWDDKTYETWTKRAAKLKSLITWNSLWDKSGVVYQRFDIKVFPTYALFDKSGKLIKTWHKPPKNLDKYLSKN